jgi:hypothetical protein
VNGKIVIKNESAKETRVLVYKQDLLPSCGKAINYTDINQHERSLGDWIQTNVDEKTLAPREEYTIYYTITLPADKVQQGSYWAVLMVEGANPIKEEQNNGMQVNSKVRYAVQVLADVGTFESPKMNFEAVELKEMPEVGKILKIRLKNDGLFSARTKLTLEVMTEKGEKIKTLDGLSKRIYPTLCNDYEIALKDLPKGKYEGVLVADNGKDLFGSTVSLDLE